MNPSYTELPEGYQLFDLIDMEKNKKLIVWVNILSILIALPLFPYFIILTWNNSSMFSILLMLVIMIVVLCLHELIHGFFFQKFGNGKVKYQFHGWAFSASMKGHYFLKKQYQIIGIAPAVILNILLIILFFILKNDAQYIVYGLFLLHFSGCAGDFYVLFRMRKYPKDSLIEDTGVGMKFYKKGEEVLPNQ